jgi:uncharacterized surface protein with fasciclin (FAS1) repeats
MTSTTLRRTGSATLALTLSMGFATACGSEDTLTPASATGGHEFGAGCADFPTTGAGSFDAMAAAPVVDAAGTHPMLRTLVAALTRAGLVDTLNYAPALTVFAPADAAFDTIPAPRLDALLADKSALTKVLTHHIVVGRLAPRDLAGTHMTLAGDTIEVTGSGEHFTVGGAHVLCGNIRTANATVYVVDGVLLPRK